MHNKDWMKYSPPCFENIIYEKLNLQLLNIFKMNKYTFKKSEMKQKKKWNTFQSL